MKPLSLPVRRAVARALLVTACLVTGPGCQSLRCPPPSGAPVSPATATPAGWRQQLAQELPALGHRNWIVVADAAYPAQTSAGIATVATGQPQLDVLRGVLQALGDTRHVRPVVHLDAELAHVPEALAPGVAAYRRELETLLAGRQVVTSPHEEIIAKLDTAGRTFRVLVLKTDLTIPYTSVFLELDCGYWGPEQERRLREALGSAR